MFHVEHLEVLSSQKTWDDSFLAECSTWNMREGIKLSVPDFWGVFHVEHSAPAPKYGIEFTG
jgi:hypothetical protein